MPRVIRTVMAMLAVSLLAALPVWAAEEMAIDNDGAAAVCRVAIDGKPVLSYQYGPEWAIPHVYPLLSPSGKELLLQRAEPPHEFPHHRALWIVDRVQLAGGEGVDFYHCWKNYKDPKKPADGYRHFIRHQRFTEQELADGAVLLGADLRWFVNETTPVLDEHRDMRVIPLGDGEYLIDLKWDLSASYGDVKFLSDWVHYAWPYLRMSHAFSGESGGTITNDQGQTGQAATNEAYANWIDYSNTVDGTTEGLAVFVFPDGERHKWLTRDYGTFGPRRPDALSGTQFTLKKGEQLTGRVGILVHQGDAASGKVAQRYQQYAEGKL